MIPIHHRQFTIEDLLNDSAVSVLYYTHYIADNIRQQMADMLQAPADACTPEKHLYFTVRHKPLTDLQGRSINPQMLLEASCELQQYCTGWLLPMTMLDSYNKLSDEERDDLFGDIDLRNARQLFGRQILGRTATQLVLVSWAHHIPDSVDWTHQNMQDLAAWFEKTKLLALNEGERSCQDAVVTFPLAQEMLGFGAAVLDAPPWFKYPTVGGVRWHGLPAAPSKSPRAAGLLTAHGSRKLWETIKGQKS